jgi:hypothetical protein
MDRQNRIGRTRQAEQIGKAGRKKVTGRTRLPDQVCHDKNDETGLPGENTQDMNSQDSHDWGDRQNGSG